MSTVASPVRTFEIDKAHSEAGFQVRHLIAKVRGRFSDFSGTIQFDEAAPARSSVAFTVNAASVDTHQPDRDAHLRSADFFAVDEFPAITFVSTSVDVKSPETFDVTGDLTIRGITRAVTLVVDYLGTAVDPWGKTRAAFEAAVTINRRDFGLMWNAALETGGFLVGDEVKITLAVQAVAA